MKSQYLKYTFDHVATDCVNSGFTCISSWICQKQRQHTVNKDTD